jgi:hypothetical protein
VTVFCPNCGTPNTDEATACAKCGTALKAAGPKVAPSKFKGTMMMSGVTPPRPQGPGAGLPPPAAPAPAAAPPAPESKQNLAFQATMLGPMTPPPGMPSIGGPPAASGFGATAAAAGGGFGAPPPAAGGGFGAPPPASDEGFGGARGGGDFGAPPAGGDFGAPPAGGDFGAPPAGGGFGAPAAGGGFGAPPAGGGFGAPPASGGGFGAPPASGGGFGAPPAGGGAPAPKKNKTAMYVGIGCGALLFLSCVCGGGAYWWMQKKAQEALETIQNYQPPAGVEPVPGSAADPAAGGKPEADSGGACAKVERCCPAFYASRGLSGDQAAATCGQVSTALNQLPAQMRESACSSQLQGFASAGGGIPLPPECQ